MKTRIIQLLLACLLIVSVGACGWHLRGSFDLSLDTIYIDGSANSEVRKRIEERLKRKKTVNVVSDPRDAGISLKILKENLEKKHSIISSAGKVSEYELLLKLEYEITKSGVGIGAVVDQLVIRRLMTYSDDNLVAKNSEEDSLIKDMYSEASRTLLVRVSALSRANDN
jgi:LPS-assembly lipoprotein